MLDSAILEVLTGLVFVYLLLSLLCTIINELLARFLQLRATNLREGIGELLADPNVAGIAHDLYNHPLISHLAHERFSGWKRVWKDVGGIGKKGEQPPENGAASGDEVPKKFLPSYISSKNFARALVDILLPAESNNGNELNALRESIQQLENESLRKALLSLADTSNRNLDEIRENIESWFDDAMDRVTGWYKRRLQYISLAIAFLITVGFNADTISIGNTLWHDQDLRTAVAEQAHQALSNCSKTPLSSCDHWTEYTNVAQELHAFPLGWPNDHPSSFGEILLSLLGWIITALAVSLGAPFWFGLLNKLDAIRTSGAKPKQGIADSA